MRALTDEGLLRQTKAAATLYCIPSLLLHMPQQQKNPSNNSLFRQVTKLLQHELLPRKKNENDIRAADINSYVIYSNVHGNSMPMQSTVDIYI